MDYDLISYAETMRMRDLYFDGSFEELTTDWRKIPEFIGLKSIDEELYWTKSGEEISFLTIVNKEKYLWARFKYGI
jgi:hypothetical protein